MKCEYHKMPQLGSCTPNKKCNEKAIYKIGKMKASDAKYFNHNSKTWCLCEYHKNIARAQYSTAYWTHEKKIRSD